MRVSEQRYAEDRRALDVAVRLIDFEARTGTIRELTGLSDTRIRTLSKECGIKDGAGPRLRHRGASPHNVSYILAKARSKNEAAALLGLCQLMGISSAPHSFSTCHDSDSVSRAERLCDAYWTFRYLIPEASIGFEHMLLLLSEAVKGEELATTHCEGCNALLVVDLLSLHGSMCLHCALDAPTRRKTAEVVQYLRVAEESPAYR
jgi:hypothetical protein